MSAAVFVHLAACAKHVDPESTSVYAMIKDKGITKIKELPGALTLKRLYLIEKNQSHRPCMGWLQLIGCLKI